MSENSLEDRLLAAWTHEAKIDVLGLGLLCQSVRYNFGLITPEEIKSRVLDLVRKLLSRGLYAINVGDGKPWENQEPDYVIERISREWDALGGEPSVPDIVWFKL